MKKTAVLTAVALALVGAGPVVAASSTSAAKTSPVTVTFVDPAKFTDLKFYPWQDYSVGLMDTLKSYIEQTGARFVPPGMHLTMTVTDVDLAGRFEPWRGPRLDTVRIIRAIYPPRIDFKFRLTNKQGAVVKSGERHLTNVAFQIQSSLQPPDDYLRYEKDLLFSWFSRAFANLPARPSTAG